MHYYPISQRTKLRHAETKKLAPGHVLKGQISSQTPRCKPCCLGLPEAQTPMGSSAVPHVRRGQDRGARGQKTVSALRVLARSGFSQQNIAKAGKSN